MRKTYTRVQQWRKYENYYTSRSSTDLFISNCFPCGPHSNTKKKFRFYSFLKINNHVEIYENHEQLEVETVQFIENFSFVISFHLRDHKKVAMIASQRKNKEREMKIFHDSVSNGRG